MKIGLVRHFKVAQEFPTGKSVSADDMKQWFIDYDAADIIYGSTSLGKAEWKECYCSDMTRAVKTAEHIFPGTIHFMEELREIPSPPLKGKVKLPFILWAIWIRCCSFMNKQTRKEIKLAKRRINKALDEVFAKGERDVLIVSHAALMVYLRKELMRRGFVGPKFRLASNGMLYVFQR
ncbi:histidine phosphatase family protein [Peribacillus sp. SI8-4]|uniref:histidine phosphatase family protein n=1 Tax=Peribacillus sp. SI8-4 TaxID=3048009 RepID=UPI0025570E71|nr:histidine phosphatase family protein [Peribacillus sp. SI8-4]